MGSGRSDGADEEVRRWLSARVEPTSALDPDEMPTTMARVVRSPRGDARWVVAPTAHDEPVDDPATEVADGSLEDARDPHTVRVHRMPLSFIGESVFDPDTAKAEGWSLPEGPVDEVPLVPRTPGTPVARPAFRPATPPPPPLNTASSTSFPPSALVPSADDRIRPVHVAVAVAVGSVLGLAGAGLVLWIAS
jgi:hypothetical protein